MLGFKKYLFVFGVTTGLFLTSCKKDEKEYVYQVTDVEVAQAGAEKPNVKTSTEYISIAYSDAFGSTIATSKLDALKTIYITFGDVGVTEDLIIRNFLADDDAEIPTRVEMEDDVDLFVTNAYKKIYNRVPSEYELWFMKDCIQKDSNISPSVVYYSLMTSNEYRQY